MPNNSKPICYINTTPGEYACSSIRINWHANTHGSILEYTISEDNEFNNSKLLKPTEKLWSMHGVKNAMPDDSFNEERIICSLEITDLKKNSEYIYRVKLADYLSDVYHFKTSSKNANFKCLIFGDFQCKENQKMHKIMDKLSIISDATLALAVGDLGDTGGCEEEWQHLFKADLFKKMIFATAVGDHEYWATPFPHILEFEKPYTYNAIFNNPKNGISCAINSNYYFFYNGCLFIALDMGDSNYNAGIMFDEEVAWLEDVLLKYRKSSRFVVIFEHKSLYGSKEIDPAVRKLITPKFTPIFDKYGVDLVISGHDHIYSRTKEIKGGVVSNDGTIYLDMGSSGNKYRSATPDQVDSPLYAKVIDLKIRQTALGAVALFADNQIKIEVYDEEDALVDEFVVLTKENNI